MRSKKILLMLALLCTIVQGAWAVNGIYCTASDKGRVVCTDGSIYDNVAAATAANRTAVAKIIWVDESAKKGLALALQDEGTYNQTYNPSAAITVCNNKNETLPVIGATWKLASQDEWNTMTSAAGGCGELRDGFSSVGGKNMQQWTYYSSTGNSGQFGYSAQALCFDSEDDDFGLWSWGYSSTNYKVRACLAFNLLTLRTISNASDWTTFCNDVNGGNDHSNYCVKLTSDISIETMMASTSGAPFCGLFDGDGHTLTVSYNTTEEYTAPFRHVKDATIKNLHVAGTITTSAKFAGGIVGESHGDLTITDCRSSVTINSSVNGDGTHGGFVSTLSGASNTITIDGCVFDGSLTTTTGTVGCGGFIGWGVYNKPTITNSLMKPSSVAANMLGSTFARWYTGDDGIYEPTITNCYYVATSNLPTNQGVQAHTSALDGEICKKITFPNSAISDVTLYSTASTVSDVEASYNLDDGIARISPTITDPFGTSLTFGTDYTATLDGNAVNSFPVYITQKGNYTLVLTAKGNYLGTKTFNIQASASDDNTLVTISSAAEWDAFASRVTNGVTFRGRAVMLTNDISVSTMAGGTDELYTFQGTFLGNGHTLTFTKGSAESAFNEEYCAPFRYTKDATIQDLNVAGDIYTSKKFAAGLVARPYGTTTITNCRVGIVIHSSVSGDGTHGGFAAYPQGNVTMTNCVFSGRMFTTNGTTRCGGFVGWHNGKTYYITNALYAPSASIVAATGETPITAECATFVRGTNLADASTCYYTEPMGTEQGIRVYASLPDNEIAKKLQLIDGNDYYMLCTVSGGMEYYWHSGNDISVDLPVITAPDGTVLIEGSDYTVSISPETMNEVGTYQLSFTAKDGSGYYGTKTINITVTDGTAVTSETTTLTSGVYVVKEDVTITSRITISGNVRLVLGEGTTLNAKKGIELSQGNSLTIDGPGALLIDGCDNDKSGIGASFAGTLTINGGVLNIKGGYRAAGIGGDSNNWASGANGVCGDVIINGGQVTANGSDNGQGIGNGKVIYPDVNKQSYRKGTLTINLASINDFICCNNLRQNNNGCSLESITIAPGKQFIIEGTNTVVDGTTEDLADVLSDKKVWGYNYYAPFVLSDGGTYTRELVPFKAPSATYKKTLGEERVGKHQAWLVPFDYTITEADLEKFTFYKINMIANSPDPTQEASDDMWMFVKKMAVGDVLHANMPYVYKPSAAVTDYEFTTENATLKAKATGVVATMQTMEDIYTLYATYEPTTATAADPFYYMSADGDLSLGDDGTISVGAFRWIMRVESKFGQSSQPAYARRRIIITDGEGSEVTGIRSLTPDPSPKGEGSDGWYTLDGRRLQAQPSQRGVYINNGNKIVIR